jgi:hypothetical protein
MEVRISSAGVAGPTVAYWLKRDRVTTFSSRMARFAAYFNGFADRTVLQRRGRPNIGANV